MTGLDNADALLLEAVDNFQATIANHRVRRAHPASTSTPSAALFMLNETSDDDLATTKWSGAPTCGLGHEGWSWCDERAYAGTMACCRQTI